MFTSKDLSFPALLIGVDNSLEVIIDSKRLSITNKEGLRHGVLLNNIIIDYQGNVYKPIKVTKMKNVNSSWKFEFFNPMYEVQLELEKQSPMLMEDLKKKISKAIKSELHFWAFQDKESVDKEIDKIEEIRKIIDLLVSKR